MPTNRVRPQDQGLDETSDFTHNQMINVQSLFELTDRLRIAISRNRAGELRLLILTRPSFCGEAGGPRLVTEAIRTAVLLGFQRMG